VPTPVIASDAHLAHDGLIELVHGSPVACYESPARAVEIERALRAADGYAFEPPDEHGTAAITAVHDTDLVDLLEHVWTDAVAAGHDGRRPLIPDTFATEAFTTRHELSGTPLSRFDRLGSYCFDTATPIVEGTYAAARAAVDVALTAARRVLDSAPLAYGLCRPPGHHAGTRLFGGYCYFNNAAIVAQRLVSLGASRAAILDVDFHHGNGTQQIFWRRGDVFYASIHADPARQYPFFLGHSNETGEGDGVGENLNLPQPADLSDDAYLAAIDRTLEAILSRPGSIIVVSLGFDTYGLDPICDFALTTPVYAEIGRRVAATGRRLVILQEGGYYRPHLGNNAVAWLRGAEGR